MPSVFTLFGELKADTNSFQQSLRAAEARLEGTEHAIAQTEARSQQLGRTNAVTARSFEKMREKTAETERKLKDAISAFNRGEISAKQFGRSIQTASNSFSGLNSRLKDTSARLTDFANKNKGMGFGATLTSANLAANAVSMVTGELKEFLQEGLKLNMSLDKLARYVGTVDNSLKNIDNLRRFKSELQDLSTRLPHSAEEFAQASYTISSGLKVFGDERIQLLEKIGKAAAASNMPVNMLADNVTGLLVAYKVPLKEVDSVFAALNTSIGKSIVTDQQYMAGLNKLAPIAERTGQSIQTLIAAMGVVTKDTKDGEMAFTNLQNVLSKIYDPQYSERLKEVFHTSFFDAQGNVKQLNVLIGDLAKELDGLTKEQQIKKIGEVFRDQQARDGILSLINAKKDLDAAMADTKDLKAYQQNVDIMLTATEARWKKAAANWENTKRGFWDEAFEGVESAFQFNINPQIGPGVDTQIGSMIVGAYMKGVEQAKPQIRSSGIAMSNVFVDSSTQALESGRPKIVATQNSIFTGLNSERTRQEGAKIGTSLWQGMVAGINDGRDNVAGAAAGLGIAASAAARLSVKSQSPSKVFYEIGSDVIAGFVQGIDTNSGKIKDSLSKSITNQVADLKKNLKTLLDENQATIGGIAQTGGLRVQTAEAEKIKSQLADLIALRIEMGLQVDKPLIVNDISGELEYLTKLKDQAAEMSDIIKDILAERDKKSGIEAALSFFTNPDNAAKIEEMSKRFGKTAEALQNIAVNAERAKVVLDLLKNIDLRTDFSETEGEEAPGIGSYLTVPLDVMDQPPELAARWTDFFASLRAGLAEMKASLPTIKTAIGENLLNSISQIGDVFGNALNAWTTRSQGFFSALAQGFRQLVSQIVSELIRLMVMKAVLNIVGSISGGLGGGSTGSASHIGGAPAPGFARGGFTGTGGVSELAGVVHKNEFVMPFEAVRKFGLGFMNSVRNLQFPQTAYAGGFMPSSSTTNNNQRSNVFNISVSGGGSRQEQFQTAQMIKREVIAGLRKEEHRNK